MIDYSKISKELDELKNLWLNNIRSSGSHKSFEDWVKQYVHDSMNESFEEYEIPGEDQVDLNGIDFSGCKVGKIKPILTTFGEKIN